MANREYKNVKRFVDGISKEVETVMEGGSTGKSSITPLVQVKTGVPIKVDFGNENDDYSLGGNYIFDWNNCATVIRGGNTASSVTIWLETNEAQTQLLASLRVSGQYYEPISNEIVIYEGDLSDFISTSEIRDQLPKVEFVIDEYDIDCVAFTNNTGISN